YVGRIKRQILSGREEAEQSTSENTQRRESLVRTRRRREDHVGHENKVVRREEQVRDENQTGPTSESSYREARPALRVGDQAALCCFLRNLHPTAQSPRTSSPIPPLYILEHDLFWEEEELASLLLETPSSGFLRSTPTTFFLLSPPFLP
ncbi:hypothetical protein U1Q18_000606, partial [Sarracenia purpurea var. burkii]